MAHEKLVRVYEGLTTADVDRLADMLNQAGIESFMDLTDAPIDGLVMGPASKIFLVPNRKPGPVVGARFLKLLATNLQLGCHGHLIRQTK